MSKLSLSNKQKAIVPLTNSSNKLRCFTLENKSDVKDRADEKIVFSFELLDRNHKYFNLGGMKKVCDGWLIELIDTFKEISSLKWIEFKKIKKFQVHPYTNNENFKFEFDDKTMVQYDAFQIRIDQSKGRIHGFIVGNRYYVYWLDPNHNMNDSPHHQKASTFPPAKSCFEHQSDRIKYLTEENIILTQLLDEVAATK